MLGELHSRNLTLGIKCFAISTLNVKQWPNGTHGIISGCGSQLFRGPIFVFTQYQDTDSVIKFNFQNTFVMKMNCSILESCVAIITKDKSSKGTPKITLMKILLMSIKHVSNWLQYDALNTYAIGFNMM